VEFGAGDDLHGSTTFRLIVQKNYRAVLIEGEKPAFEKLKKIYADNEKIILKNCYVGFDDQTGLDKILAGTPVPHVFDFLSIDIDGNDYHAWHAIKNYQPKILMIEFNPTIPP
jgi:predicted glycosyltransferase